MIKESREGGILMKDSEIVTLYWDRNEDAILQTQKKYGAYLSKTAYNILADFEDSKECVNDTYFSAWNSIPPHRPAFLSTYLAKITRQLAIDRFRKKNAVKRYASEYAVSLDELGDTFSGGTSAEQVLDAKLLDAAINQFVCALPEDVQRAFVGRYYFFDSLKDIARYCGMKESKLKSLLYRTRQQLKEHLTKEGFDL